MIDVGVEKLSLVSPQFTHITGLCIARGVTTNMKLNWMLEGELISVKLLLMGKKEK